MQTSQHNQETDYRKTVEPSLFYRYRNPLFYYSVSTLIIVVCCTTLLYSFYGPLTPNCNRYYHHFDISTIIWKLVLLSFLSFANLSYPFYRLKKSKNPELYKRGIFPAKNTFTRIISSVLTFLNILSGTIFTITFVYITIEYITNTSRVMAEDWETILLSAAYIGCILFWGMINIVYALAHRVSQNNSR